MSRNVYTQEQHQLDAMLSISGIGHDTDARAVLNMALGFAAVMRENCNWSMTLEQGDNVVNEVCKRFNI